MILSEVKYFMANFTDYRCFCALVDKPLGRCHHAGDNHQLPDNGVLELYYCWVALIVRVSHSWTESVCARR
jgi:hypothetical protein